MFETVFFKCANSIHKFYFDSHSLSLVIFVLAYWRRILPIPLGLYVLSICNSTALDNELPTSSDPRDNRNINCCVSRTTYSGCIRAFLNGVLESGSEFRLYRVTFIEICSVERFALS